MLRWIKRLLVLFLAAAAGLFLYGWSRDHPEDLPWTRLDLSRPVGAFTGQKLAALAGDPERCAMLLDRSGVRFDRLAPLRAGQCGYEMAVRLDGGSLAIRWASPAPATSCPVAAALALWEWHVVQPAAIRNFGQEVRRVEHFGSYSCRRIYGRSEGAWSEHSSANAVDVAAFVLMDGTRIRIVDDWRSGGPREAFLHEVRDGACDLFATVLSPDYNAAHRDHLHLDQADRGRCGWRGCR